MARADAADSCDVGFAANVHFPAAVGDLGRSVKIELAILSSAWLPFAGCGHYAPTHLRVVDDVSGGPVPDARLTTSLSLGPLRFSDLFRPEWTHTQKQEAHTDSDGLATLRVPLSRSSSMHSPGVQDQIGATVTVSRYGYDDRLVWHSNNHWKKIGAESGRSSPYVIRLTPSNTEPASRANRR